MKLRSRLYVLVAATVVPMVLLAGLAAYQMQKTMRASALQGIQETANATALIIDREITAAITSVKVLANSPAIADKDWKRFYDLASSATYATSGWVILYEPDGKQIINTRFTFGAVLPNRTVNVKIADILQHTGPQVSGMTWSPVLNKYIILVEYPVRTSDGHRYVLSQAFFANHFNVAVLNRGLQTPGP